MACFWSNAFEILLDSDVDECLEGNKCLGEQEVCVNNEGSYSCECKEGYARDHKEKVCKIDVNGMLLLVHLLLLGFIIESRKFFVM